MAGNYTQLKNDIIDYVKQNGDNLITGNGLQGQLLAMVNSLGAGYQYMGVARLTPTPTDPGTPDQKVFYLAAQPGTYTNFSGLVVNDGEVAVLKWDTAWHKEVTGAATAAQVTELGQYVDNPEFVEVHTDEEGKVLYGVKKNGDFHFGAGTPEQVIDSINKAYKELDNIKVDKEAGKSLIDSEVASSKSIIDSEEYLEVKTDLSGNVVEAIRKDGTKVFWGGAKVYENFEIGGDLGVLGNLDISGAKYVLMESPEWLKVLVDMQGRVIAGIKPNGEYVFRGGIDINNSPGLKELLDKSNELSEKISALEQIISLVENAEYLSVEVDADGRILSARKKDGTKVENLGMEVNGVSSLKIINIDGTFVQNIADIEGRIEIKTDSDGKIISYRDGNGVLHENVGIELSENAMTDFKKHLSLSTDWTFKDSMQIAEPKLAHLNIIGGVSLENLSKEGMPNAIEGVNYNVPVEVEFTDGQGNYFKKYALLSGQGRSSLAFVKKGLSFDFFNEDPRKENFNEDNTFKMRFGKWVAQDSFHIKSFYTDWPRCTTPVVYNLANEVFETRGVMEDRPYKKYYVNEYLDSAYANTQSDLSHNMETGARCVPAGFPVIVYHNGEFWGVNSWQLKKSRDNYQLNKKKSDNIHLDGDMSRGAFVGEDHDPFWLWNGSINWAVYCSGAGGIETRNPKNLYCIDGKKYNADTHNVEIIDSATAEEWIAAGEIIPTHKVIDTELAGYLRTTGKVRESIEALTTYVPYIQGMIDGGASNSEIKAAIAERFDVNSFIDYILIDNITGDQDAWDNNGQIITWGKLDGSNNLNWSVNVYDCDYTFGCSSGGYYANAANASKGGSTYPLYSFFWTYYLDELKERYKELRDRGIFDASHITGLFRSWMDRVGYDNYVREYKKWPESPCFRDGSLTYTKNPTTGGFYGSIERIYLWLKNRITYMDAANFFDYNN